MEKELFTVTDVYEHAASIGKDIEQIVHDYGKEAIEGTFQFPLFFVPLLLLF